MVSMLFLTLFLFVGNHPEMDQDSDISFCMARVSDGVFSKFDMISLKKGFLDRFENDQAVILIEKEGLELVLPKDCIPTNSAVHSWFQVFRVNHHVFFLSIDQMNTDRRKVVIRQLLHILKGK